MRMRVVLIIVTARRLVVDPLWTMLSDAVMSNHLHVVLGTDPEQAAVLTDAEVARR